jgi:hypothetical protein
MIYGRPSPCHADDQWTAYRLTVGGLYLLFPTDLHDRINRASYAVYWRFMASQLKRVGVSQHPVYAFAD